MSWAILLALAALITAIIAIKRVNRMHLELTQLQRQLATTPASNPPQPALSQAQPKSAEPTTPVPPALKVAAPQPASVATIAARASTPKAASASGASLEERLTVNWAVWGGAIAMALAVVFMVRYSIEQGLLGPEVRIVSGILFGILLLATGEWLRRSADHTAVLPRLRQALGVPPQNIPPALVAAGIVALFAAIYSAHAVYDLAGPITTFAALATVSAGSMALSLLHGRFVALLGQIAAFVVPALVANPDPSAWALFAYVLAVAGGGLALAHWRRWRTTAWIAVSGAVLWTLIFFMIGWRADAAAPCALFLVLFALACVALGPRHEVLPGVPDSAWWKRDGLPDVPLVLTFALAVILVRMSNYDLESLLAIFGLTAIVTIVGRREEPLDHIPWVAALAVVATLASWHLPSIIEQPLPLGVVQGRATGFVPGPLTPPSLAIFTGVATLAAILFGVAGAFGLWGACRPARWAVLSAAPPLAILAIAYWRIEDFAPALPWSGIGLVLALAALLMVYQLNRHRDDPNMIGALGVYAVAVTAAIALSFVMSLRLGWLTVALSLEIPALAWIAHRLPLPILRHISLVVGAAVVARLLLNPWLPQYPLSPTPIINELLYTYGLPAVAFAIGARLFARGGRDYTVLCLEAAAIAFTVALISLEIRHFVGDGKVDNMQYDLLEASLHSIAWLVSGFVLLRRDGTASTPVTDLGWRILAGAGAAQVIGIQLLAKNPLVSTIDVGDLPVINLLAVAYFVPGLLAALFAWQLGMRRMTREAAAAGVASLALIFVYLTLEVTRAFHGGYLRAGPSGDAEYYAYSAVWLVYGAMLLLLGLRFQSPGLRYASLAVICLTVAKVFLFDMSNLTGLLRAFSFLGLGLALFAISWLYQRFVFPKR